jgi:ATP-dependent Clp protease ATP-binding subunit ClpC
MNCSVAVFQRSRQGQLEWTTLGLWPHRVNRRGKNPVKIQKGLVDELRKILLTVPPHGLAPFKVTRGIRIETLHLELGLPTGEGKLKVSGNFPLVIEPRPRTTDPDDLLHVAYHPLRQSNWFPIDPEEPLADQASAFFRADWKDIDDDAVQELKADKKDTLKWVSFVANHKTLLDLAVGADPFADLDVSVFRGERRPKRGPLRALPELGVNLSEEAAGGVFPTGMPRSPYREQLLHLLGGAHRSPVLLVGPPGCGKSTLLRHLVKDLLELDGFAIHRNLDRIRQCWQVSGKRIIAGMSYVGDWQQRCLDLLHDARDPRRILLVTDIAGFGRIGRSRDSDANLAQFFQAALARGEITLVGECTPGQLKRLEDDAPSFAALFTQIRVHPTSNAETLRMLFGEARQLEGSHRVAFEADLFSAILEQTGSLMPWAAFPGKALDVLRELAQSLQTTKRPGDIAELLGLLSRKTGLPRFLLEAEKPLTGDEVEAALGRSVMGQGEALSAAGDLVLRIRAGLTDPRRPYGVFLMTGPTGTGKTELARSLASFLFGHESRLLRFDMAEFGTADAVARLCGDSFAPQGLLAGAVRAQPFSVVLLDEIDKAHPAVLNLLLQLFDEGRLTDAAGDTADFTHTVVLMTANLGSQVRSVVRIGEPSGDEVRHDVDRAVREFFPPELFNRIDRVVHFQPLTEEAAHRIAEKELGQLMGRQGLTSRNIFVSVAEDVRARIVRDAFDVRYGARPLKRYLEENIGTPLAEHIVARPRALMELVQLSIRNDGVALDAQPLVPREAVNARFVLEELDTLPTEILRGRLAELRTRAEQDDFPAARNQLAEQIRVLMPAVNQGQADAAESVYRLEVFRDALQEISSRAGELTAGRRGQKPVGREELLELLGRLHFIHRALPRAGDPNQHGLCLELKQIGKARAQQREPPAGSSLIRWLADAYVSAPGQVDGYVARFPDGREIEGEDFPRDLPGEPNHLVLHIAGAAVADFYEGEEGCHVWESLGRLPEIVRVRRVPSLRAPSLRGQRPKQSPEQPESLRGQGPKQSPEDPESLRGQGPKQSPEDPEQPLPVVRHYRFEPPLVSHQLATLELEDYFIPLSLEVKARTLAEGLRPLFRIRMSRVDAMPT